MGGGGTGEGERGEAHPGSRQVFQLTFEVLLIILLVKLEMDHSIRTPGVRSDTALTGSEERSEEMIELLSPRA